MANPYLPIPGSITASHGPSQTATGVPTYASPSTSYIPPDITTYHGPSTTATGAVPPSYRPGGSTTTTTTSAPTYASAPNSNLAWSQYVNLDPLVISAVNNQIKNGLSIRNMLGSEIGNLAVQSGIPGLASKLGGLAASSGYNQGVANTQDSDLTGLYPAGLDTSFSLDPSLQDQIDQATKAGLTGWGQINFNTDLAQKGVINQLAGSGLLFSGDTGYKTGLVNTSDAQQKFGLEQGTLGTATQDFFNALMQQQALAAQVANAKNFAYQNWLAKPTMIPGLTTSSTSYSGGGPDIGDYSGGPYVPAFSANSDPWAPGGAVSQGYIPYENQPLMDTRSVGGYIAPVPQFGGGGGMYGTYWGI